jgi:hypothetical protein
LAVADYSECEIAKVKAVDKKSDDLKVADLNTAEAIRLADGVKWLERLRKKYRGRLPADFKFDRTEANSRE